MSKTSKLTIVGFIGFIVGLSIMFYDGFGKKSIFHELQIDPKQAVRKLHSSPGYKSQESGIKLVASKKDTLKGIASRLKTEKAKQEAIEAGIQLETL
jgi:hypothetical protein